MLLLFFTFSQFPFSNEQVRILLYCESDWRGRILLFDSTAIEKVNLSSNGTTTTTTTPNHQQHGPKKQSSTGSSCGGDKKQPPSTYIDTVGGYVYRYPRSTESDFNSIGEMVFGSVAMSVRSTTLKVIF